MISAQPAFWNTEALRWSPTGVGQLSAGAVRTGTCGSPRKASVSSQTESVDHEVAGEGQDAHAEINWTTSTKPQTP